MGLDVETQHPIAVVAFDPSSDRDAAPFGIFALDESASDGTGGPIEHHVDLFHLAAETCVVLEVGHAYHFPTFAYALAISTSPM